LLRMNVQAPKYRPKAKNFLIEFRREMERFTNELVEQIRNQVPVGASKNLRNGIRAGKVSMNQLNVVVVGKAKAYAGVIEKGRRPGAKFPPPGEIEKWITGTREGKQFLRQVRVGLKLRNRRRALKTAVYLKSRGISVYGIQAQNIFRDTLADLGPQLSAALQDLADAFWTQERLESFAETQSKPPALNTTPRRSSNPRRRARAKARKKNKQRKKKKRR